MNVIKQGSRRGVTGSADVKGEVTSSAVKGAARQMRFVEGWRASGVAGAIWLALGIGTFAAAWLVPGNGRLYATAGLSGLATLFGLWVYWRHGGSRITAIGIYNFSFALFVGFAGLYQVSEPPTGVSPDSFLSAISWCYFLQVVTWFLFWTSESSPASSAVTEGSPQVARWAVITGALMLLASVLTYFLSSRSEVLVIAQGGGFCGLVLIGVALLPSPIGRRWLLYALIFSAAFAVYFRYLFDGFGRIVLASLGFALCVFLSHRFSGRLVKSAVLLGAIPGLLVLAKVRADVADQLHPAYKETGFESIVSPLYSLVRVMDYDAAGLLQYDWGYTFWSALTALVPRAVWPGKPVGFGSELARLLSPQYLFQGHSDAALFFGEWLFNFGLFGFLLMVPVTGLLLRGLDQLLARTLRFPLDSRYAVVRYTIAVVAAVGVIDIMWMGAFSYMARTGARVLVLSVLLLVLAPAIRGRLAGKLSNRMRRRTVR